MLKICPVSAEKMNENVARSTALLVAATLVAVLLLPPLRWLLAWLVFDFYLRGFGPQPFSLFAQLSKRLVAALGLPPHSTNLAPKQFGARIGFILASLAGLLLLFGWVTAGLSVAAIILVFALLEGLAGICVACLIYPFVLRWQGE